MRMMYDITKTTLNEMKTEVGVLLRRLATDGYGGNIKYAVLEPYSLRHI